jgi:hypothetical protein
MVSIASLSGTPGLGSVNSAPPFSFKSSSAVRGDYGSKPSVSALMNPTLHNNVPEPMVNSTARVPIFARPFTRGFEKNYSEGDILFVQRGDERSAHTTSHGSHNVVANIPVLNHLLRTTLVGGTGIDKADLKYGTVKDVLDNFNYFGILNNDMDTGSKWQRLLNVNVRGRSRVARMWQPVEGRLKRGDQLWLAFVVKNTVGIETFRGPGGVREAVPRNTQYVQVVPTLDCCQDFEDAEYLIPVGIVSQVTMKKPSRVQINDALYVTEKCKLLERIEVLMRI